MLICGCGEPFRTPEETAEMLVTKSYKPGFVRFRQDLGRFPTTAEGLAALVTEPNGGLASWKGPYVRAIHPDPWGNQLQYRSPGKHNFDTYDFWSLGPDGIESEDDIGNW